MTDKELHDLTMFYLEKNFSSLKDLKQLFNTYITTKDELQNLFLEYNKVKVNNDFKMQFEKLEPYM